MSSTCLFSISFCLYRHWYEKTIEHLDMHPFIHRFLRRSGVGITQRLGNLQRYRQSIFAAVCVVILAKKLTWYYNPYCMTLGRLSHGRVSARLAQGECDAVLTKTAEYCGVERDYLHERFTSPAQLHWW